MDDRHREAVLNTYRFLRIGMVAIVVLLAASVAWERGRAGCLQPSISAYYYTAAHSVFIAALCALGACLIAYHGSSDVEDSLLNFSGFLAFIVAMVPTDRPSAECAGLVVGDIANAVSNNVTAVFVAGLFVVALRYTIKWEARKQAVADDRTTEPPLADPTSEEGPVARTIIRLLSWISAKWIDRVGYLIVAVGAAVFVFAREEFVARAHVVAAVTMFIGVILVMSINAYSARPRNPRSARYARHYRLVTLIMALALVATVIAHIVTGGGQLVFWLEAAVIASFTAFWAVQTWELRNVVDRKELLERPGAAG